MDDLNANASVQIEKSIKLMELRMLQLAESRDIQAVALLSRQLAAAYSAAASLHFKF